MVICNGVFSLLAVVSTAIGAASAYAASDMQALTNKSGCFSCHSIHIKTAGPALADVVAKHKGNTDAPARLVQKVREGGRDVWGRIPVPVHSNLKEDEAK